MRRLGNLRADTVRIQDATELIAQELTPQLTALDARLKELGPEPAPDAPPESPEVQQERADLSRERGDIDARIKRARLLSVAADQAGDQITAKRRALFDEKLWQRTKSVLAPSFWMDLNRSLPRDVSRLQDFWNANVRILRGSRQSAQHRHPGRRLGAGAVPDGAGPPVAGGVRPADSRSARCRPTGSGGRRWRCGSW